MLLRLSLLQTLPVNFHGNVLPCIAAGQVVHVHAFRRLQPVTLLDNVCHHTIPLRLSIFRDLPLRIPRLLLLLLLLRRLLLPPLGDAWTCTGPRLLHPSRRLQKQRLRVHRLGHVRGGGGAAGASNGGGGPTSAASGDGRHPRPLLAVGPQSEVTVFVLVRLNVHGCILELSW